MTTFCHDITLHVQYFFYKDNANFVIKSLKRNIEKQMVFPDASTSLRPLNNFEFAGNVHLAKTVQNLSFVAVRVYE